MRIDGGWEELGGCQTLVENRRGGAGDGWDHGCGTRVSFELFAGAARALPLGRINPTLIHVTESATHESAPRGLLRPGGGAMGAAMFVHRTSMSIGRPQWKAEEGGTGGGEGQEKWR